MFLKYEELTTEIKSILREPSFMCAVAYWGAGAQDWLGNADPDIKIKKMIVCDAVSGGTNPKVLKELRSRSDVDIRHCEALHAKVYIGANSCVVASSNASTNGVGVEGGQAARLIEAGSIIKRTPEIVSWFVDIWNKAKEIDDKIIVRAEEAWKKRRQVRPSDKFADFEPTDLNPPLLYWYSTDVELKVPEDALKTAKRNKELAVLKEAQKSNNLILSETSSDTKVLEEKPWLLLFQLTKGKKPPKGRNSVMWFRPGLLIKGGIQYEDDTELRDAFLPNDNPGTEPFDLSEKHVWDAIWKTLNDERFKFVVGLDYETKAYKRIGYLSKDRIDAHTEFWMACKDNYKKLGLEQSS